jgi:catechol 2,3-dioxygenase-like lactoylglutathione lyase family enzyme
MSKVNVRYIVSDVNAAIRFYTDMLGFNVEMHLAPGFASLSRGDLQLLLNRLAPAARDKLCGTGSLPLRAVGTESRSQLRISKPLSKN